MADRVTSMLAHIQQILSNDVELSRMVRYRVQEKGCNERSRLAKVQEYKGPDPDTMKILSINHHIWLQNPSAFWACSLPVVTHSTNSQVEIVDRYLQVNLSD